MSQSLNRRRNNEEGDFSPSENAKNISETSVLADMKRGITEN